MAHPRSKSARSKNIRRQQPSRARPPEQRRPQTRERERRFVDAYFTNKLNVTQAVMIAYELQPDQRGAASSLGYEIMRRPTVLALIAARRKAEGDAAAERKQRIVAKLEAVAFGDVRQLFDDAGNLNPITRLDDDTQELIAGLEVNEMQIGENAMSITRKVKITDKMKARELLAKMDGTLVERHELGGKNGKPLTIELVQFCKDEKEAA